MKICRKCGVQFEVRNCPSCKKVIDARYRENNKEKERVRSRMKRGRQDPVKALARTKKWQASNAEKLREYQKQRYANFAWKIRSDGKKWKAAHPEARRIHDHNRRASKRKNGGKLSKGLAEKLFKLQRGKCACGCGKALGNEYHLDHRMPIALGGTNTDDNIQLLTNRCNLQKHAKHPVEFMQERGFLL